VNSLPRLLLIGPLPISGDVIGGTKVSFASMVAELKATGRYQVLVRNTSRRQPALGRLGRFVNNLAVLTLVALRILAPGKKPVAAVFNTSSGGALKAGWLLWACCKLRRIPLVIRVFGGDLDLFFKSANPFVRLLARRTLLRADLLLLQTNDLCETFKSARRLRHWPTTRELSAPPSNGAERALQFVFIGQLRREKGLAEALEAAESLPQGGQLWIYGPSMPGFNIKESIKDERCFYGGALSSQQVPLVLSRFDALIFPSYHKGEGMPGILVEALQSGLPVISTRWRALPEIIKHEENGLLIEPGDSSELAAAMNRLATEPELFSRLRLGALSSGELYRASRWASKLCGWIDELQSPKDMSSRREAPHGHGEAA
jgi:glycosyltransferase involved in cell wall biosynthesis